MKRNIKEAYFLSLDICLLSSRSCSPSSFGSVFYREALKNAAEVGISAHDQSFSRKMYHSIKRCWAQKEQKRVPPKEHAPFMLQLRWFVHRRTISTHSNPFNAVEPSERCEHIKSFSFSSMKG